MTRIRMALSDSLERDYECSKHVIDCIRVVERQYDDLYELAEGILDGENHDGLAEFLNEQKRRFKREED